jgi:predicted RND superfamily exporter protein
MRYFAFYATFAIASSYLLTFFFMPRLIPLFKVTIKSVSWSRISDYIEKVVINYRKSIIAFALMLLLGSLIGLRGFKTNENNQAQFSSHHPFMKELTFFKEKLGFAGEIELIIHTKRSVILSRKSTHWQKEINDQLMNIKGVTRVSSFYDLKKEINEQTNRDELMAIYDQLGIFSAMVPSLYDESKWRIVLNEFDSQNVQRVVNQIRKELRPILNKYDLKISFSGYGYIRAQLMSFFAETFFSSISFAFVSIFICFLVIFRSFKLALVGLIPNVAPIIFLWGFYSYFNININFFLIILSCVILGVSVDDTIHFMHEWSVNRSKKISDVLKNILRPLILTTIVLNGLFSFFFLSSFSSFLQVAFSLIGAFSIALLLDLFLLPAILMKRGR